VLIDSRLDVGADARILKGEPPIIFTVSADAVKRGRLEALGAEVVTARIDPSKDGKTDLAAIARELGNHGFNEVTVETGAKLNGSLIAAGVIDEIVLYLAPKILGDTGVGLFAIPELKRLADAQQLRITDVRSVGPDLRLTARIVR
jgi:diaminohydroxyphosphoribosylaminopyrimidine deaminase / 5-amino-6-(5-phosphoribosylamino)uracil reductase